MAAGLCGNKGITVLGVEPAEFDLASPDELLLQSLLFRAPQAESTVLVKHFIKSDYLLLV